MALREAPVYVQLLAPFALLVIGIGIAMWLSPIPDDELTTAQSSLIDIADWIIKASVGAILGLGSSARIRARKSNGAAK